MANGVIIWNGVASDTLGIVVSKVPSLNRPQRKYNSYSVPGRNGDIIVMQDAYAEYEQEYEIFALDGAQIDARAIVDWLYQDGWCQLSDDWEPDYYRMAYFVGPVDIEPIMDEAAVCTITFRCKPERYLSAVNLLPDLVEGTTTGGGKTIAVDANGVATLSGTSTSESIAVQVYFQRQFSFDASTDGAVFYLNNSHVFDGEIWLCQRSGSSTVRWLRIPFDEPNKKVTISVGENPPSLFLLLLLAPQGVTVSGTIRPELKMIGEKTITVANNHTINNPTNHIAYPVITLRASEYVPNMLDLETPYDLTSDYTTTGWVEEWNTDIAFGYQKVGTYFGQENKIIFTTYRQSGTPTAQGGSLISHVNSTGTIRFKPFRWVDSDVGIMRGITLRPGTTYTISCNTTSGASKIWVGFFEMDGFKPFNSAAVASRNGAGQLSLTFTVPVNCANTLFIFYRTDNTEGTFSNIMLTSGKTIEPFHPYVTKTTETFSIGDITLQFTTSGFKTAVIDCEKETFTIDGVNANTQSTVLDQYGNLSTEYLHLSAGKSVVEYSANIASAIIEPRFWEL